MQLGYEIITGLDQAITFEKLFSKPAFIMMIGLPGSGKSTIAKELAEIGNAKIFSSDEYRARLLGDENDQTNNQLVFDTLYKDMLDCILIGDQNVIFDATNITIKDRKRCLEKLSRYSINKIAYFVNTLYEQCIENDRNRDRSVGTDVIDKFIAKFQFPQKFEGFDQIIMHHHRSAEPNYDFQVAAYYLNKMKGFDQRNPHHLYSLDRHCVTLATYANNETHNNILTEAGYFHDIGKLFTQRIDENGVAHYYNHDSVGAYEVATHPEITFLKNWDDIYEMIFYINFHMRAHRDFCGDKAERKYRKLFGDRLFNNLMQFAEWDRLASGTYNKEKN